MEQSEHTHEPREEEGGREKNSKEWFAQLVRGLWTWSFVLEKSGWNRLVHIVDVPIVVRSSGH